MGLMSRIVRPLFAASDPRTARTDDTPDEAPRPPMWNDQEIDTHDHGGPDGPAPRFAQGDTVAWAGPPDVAAVLHLEPGHPGLVEANDSTSVIVRWIDNRGWFEHVGVIQQEWLEPLSLDAFDRHTHTLRSSPWPGFPVGE